MLSLLIWHLHMVLSPKFLVDAGLHESNEEATKREEVLGEIDKVTSGDTVYTSAVMFEDLKLSDELIKGLYVEMGFSKPSKTQAITIPMILTPPYKDLVAQAHNGSGKTTCFVLGMSSL
ncbi:ATP-dependent RNA helicase [Musa troglodytarum]|uniref:ATP-dependent RNA helicase n=1 Tax=Musa troglodytarum TaxID=320322 RepID=A0A9E7IBS7_9LILI|nr:ATP-dependent RNA helicase [Musa troglodytarum]